MDYSIYKNTFYDPFLALRSGTELAVDNVPSYDDSFTVRVCLFSRKSVLGPVVFFRLSNSNLC